MTSGEPASPHPPVRTDQAPPQAMKRSSRVLQTTSPRREHVRRVTLKETGRRRSKQNRTRNRARAQNRRAEKLKAGSPRQRGTDVPPAPFSRSAAECSSDCAARDLGLTRQRARDTSVPGTRTEFSPFTSKVASQAGRRPGADGGRPAATPAPARDRRGQSVRMTERQF